MEPELFLLRGLALDRRRGRRGRRGIGAGAPCEGDYENRVARHFSWMNESGADGKR
jgi:hypothetical protein